MNKALKTLRAVQWSLAGSMVLYVALGAWVRPALRGIDPSLSYIFTTLAVAIVGVIFVIRRTLVFRAEASLATEPDDPLNLSQWKTGYIATYALCETLALSGLVQHFLGASLQQSALYYLGGFVLLLFFGAQQPQPKSASST